jgi:hypothetical protein
MSICDQKVTALVLGGTDLAHVHSYMYTLMHTYIHTNAQIQIFTCTNIWDIDMKSGACPQLGQTHMKLGLVDQAAHDMSKAVLLLIRNSEHNGSSSADLVRKRLYDAVPDSVSCCVC